VEAAMLSRPQTEPSNRGFSLLELLVVIAVIGALVAILLWAVQSARAASRKTACANHMRQIGVGLANYESANEQFPPGQSWVDREPPNDFSYSWAAQILSFIELQNIQDQLDFKQPFITPENHSVASQVIPIYLCPATSIREQHRNADDQLTNLDNVKGISDQPTHNIAAGNGLACTDYLGIAGPDKEAKNLATGLEYGPQRGVLIGTKGLKGELRLKVPPPVRANSIIDGLSKTACVTECSGRGLDGDGDFHGAWVSGKNIGHVSKSINSAKPPKVWTNERVYSQHPGGAHFLFCDGSIHFLQNETKKEILNGVCSRDGEEVEQDIF
jgi:prepilin-type N-terminal cleavage/methylation domain-containing protein/prepilin-type processing-associated H-X9-DG protein